MEVLKEIFSIWRYEGLQWHWYELFLVAVLFSFLATPVCRFIGYKYGILDLPDKRKVHSKPTPRTGGIAIYIGFVVAALFNFHFSIQLKGVLLASTVMLIVGLIEDFHGVSALIRLLVQLLSVVILIAFDVSLNLFPPHPALDVLEWLITFVWVLGITNAFNFADGLNGLASSIGLIACFAFLVIANQSGQTYLGFLAACMGGACLGFLPYNFPKASIFMGDTGSTFVGFFLASLGIMGEWSEGNLLISVACPVLILALLIYDMIYITASRIWHGKVRNFKEWIEYTGKDHLHHRLMSLGMNSVQAVGMVCFMSLILGISAIKIREGTIDSLLLEFLQVAAIMVLISTVMIAGRKNISHK